MLSIEQMGSFARLVSGILTEQEHDFVKNLLEKYKHTLQATYNADLSSEELENYVASVADSAASLGAISSNSTDITDSVHEKFKQNYAMKVAGARVLDNFLDGFYAIPDSGLALLRINRSKDTFFVCKGIEFVRIVKSEAEGSKEYSEEFRVPAHLLLPESEESDHVEREFFQAYRVWVITYRATVNNVGQVLIAPGEPVLLLSDHMGIVLSNNDMSTYADSMLPQSLEQYRKFYISHSSQKLMKNIPFFREFHNATCRRIYSLDVIFERLSRYDNKNEKVLNFCFRAMGAQFLISRILGSMYSTKINSLIGDIYADNGKLSKESIKILLSIIFRAVQEKAENSGCHPTNFIRFIFSDLLRVLRLVIWRESIDAERAAQELLNNFSSINEVIEPFHANDPSQVQQFNQDRAHFQYCMQRDFFLSWNAFQQSVDSNYRKSTNPVATFFSRVLPDNFNTYPEFLQLLVDIIKDRVAPGDSLAVAEDRSVNVSDILYAILSAGVLIENYNDDLVKDMQIVRRTLLGESLGYNLEDLVEKTGYRKALYKLAHSVASFTAAPPKPMEAQPSHGV